MAERLRGSGRCRRSSEIIGDQLGEDQPLGRRPETLVRVAQELRGLVRECLTPLQRLRGAHDRIREPSLPGHHRGLADGPSLWRVLTVGSAHRSVAPTPERRLRAVCPE